MKRCLLLTISLLLLAGPAGAQNAEKTYVLFPTGDGDPDAITCRPPNVRLKIAEACKRNSVWAQYRRDGMDVAPDGIHDVPLHNSGGISCTSIAVPGAANISMRMNLRCMEPVPEGTHPAPLPDTNAIRCTTAMQCS